MSLSTQTIRLGDERNRLDDRLDELAEQIVAADEPGTLQSEAARVETRLSGVAHLVDVHGPEATVTVSGLTAGEYAQVEDELAAMRAEAGNESLPGASTNVFAAGGLVAAPFLDEREPALETALAAVSDQPVGVAKWLEQQVNDLTTVEGNGYEPLSARIAAKREG